MSGSNGLMADAFIDGCVNRCIDAAIDSLSEEMTEARRFWTNPPPFESPLEEAFFFCWHVVDRCGGSDAGRTRLRWQVPVDGYRLDFQVVSDVPGFPQIAIELDGHEFHERTKEQVALRNSRDRALTARGWKVFHISGSEFYADPHGVTSDIWGEAYEAWRVIASGEAARRA